MPAVELGTSSILCAPAPPAFIVQRSPLREKAMFLPSGDQDGDVPAASRFCPLPFGFTVHNILPRSNMISFPEGDQVGLFWYLAPPTIRFSPLPFLPITYSA